MRDRSALEFKWGEKKVGGEQKKKKKDMLSTRKDSQMGR